MRVGQRLGERREERDRPQRPGSLSQPVAALGRRAHPQDEVREALIQAEPSQHLGIPHAPPVELEVVDLLVDPHLGVRPDSPVSDVRTAEDPVSVQAEAQLRQLHLVQQILRLPAAVHVLRPPSPRDGSDEPDPPPRREPAQPPAGLRGRGEPADRDQHPRRHGVHREQPLHARVALPRDGGTPSVRAGVRVVDHRGDGTAARAFAEGDDTPAGLAVPAGRTLHNPC